MEILEYLANPEIRKDIEPLFISAFPEEERPNPHYYFSSFKTHQDNKLFGFYDSGVFIGFASVITYQDFCYIFFLAVSPEHRKQGYGSIILSELRNMYKDYVICLCYEEVDKKYPDYELRKKREQFYLRNGFKKNPLMTNEFGVVFQTAYIGNHLVTFEDYQEIFGKCFGNFAVEHLKDVTKTF